MAVASGTIPAAFDTLGLHTANPWVLPAIRLLFANPRTYEPLVDAWHELHPNTKPAIARLHAHRFALYQPEIIVNTITGDLAYRPSRAVPRYVATKKGRLFVSACLQDAAVFTDRYPRTAPANVTGAVALLNTLALRGTHRNVGLSLQHSATGNPLVYATARWWFTQWLADGYIKLLPFKLGDIRPVVPGHWRMSTAGAAHLTRLCRAIPAWEDLPHELGLSTFRQIAPIDALRVSNTGSTDYDHDIGFQRVLAALLSSPTFVTDAMWRAERVIRLPVNMATDPWTFAHEGNGAVSYQPDGMYTERMPDGKLRAAVLEYERSQTRREAWGHVERFLGYVHTTVPHTQPVVLRFVVDSRTRENTYVSLADAFTDYLRRNPQRAPRNIVTLAVSSKDRLLSAADPLADTQWSRVTWTGKGAGAPTVHHADHSPYDEYF